MASAAFGNKKAKKPHLLIDGTGGEVALLRTQVEQAFVTVEIQTRYLLARDSGIHMAIDDEGLSTLAALPTDGSVTQAVANARAEVLRATMISHMGNVGTPLVDGEHLHSDTVNSAVLAAIPTLTPSSLLAACITLVNGLQAANVVHGNAADIHFHNDAAAVASTMTTNPPVTLANVVVDLNDIKTNFLAHYLRN